MGRCFIGQWILVFLLIYKEKIFDIKKKDIKSEDII